jgi:hypothetical protein
MTGQQAFFIFATAVDFLTAFGIIGALFTDRMQRLRPKPNQGLNQGPNQGPSHRPRPLQMCARARPAPQTKPSRTDIWQTFNRPLKA